MSKKTTAQCHCIIRHARTPAERDQVRQGLEYARMVGDSVGTLLAIAQLSPCKADPVTEATNHVDFALR